MDVAVTRGAVSLHVGQQDVVLKAGVLGISRDGKIHLSRLSQGQILQLSAWRDGLIELNGEPLGVALSEINRYSPRRIYTDDPNISKLGVAGRFGIHDADKFLSVLKLRLDVDHVVMPDGTIKLTAGTMGKLHR